MTHLVQPLFCLRFKSVSRVRNAPKGIRVIDFVDRDPLAGFCLATALLWHTGDGAYGAGNVFKLIPFNDGWVYTSLDDFTGTSGSDGAYPDSTLVLDANGNVYGTASEGAINDAGTVFDITPLTALLSRVWSFRAPRGNFGPCPPLRIWFLLITSLMLS